MVIKRAIKKGIEVFTQLSSPRARFGDLNQPVYHDVAVIPSCSLVCESVRKGYPPLPQPFSILQHWLSVLALNLCPESSSTSHLPFFLLFFFFVFSYYVNLRGTHGIENCPYTALGEALCEWKRRQVWVVRTGKAAGF